MSQRSDPRQKTLKSGRVIYNLGRSALDVRVSNLSETGARLKLSIVWPSPPVFELELLQPNFRKPITRKCERIWQRGYEIGVRYLN
jgi:hypothetical protein